MSIIEKQYEMRVTIPTYWINKSIDLHSSARVLWMAMEDNSKLEVSCFSTYKMLMGMSFEVLIKAHCIAQKIESEEVQKSHRLTNLASIAGLKLTKEENKILDVLTEYVIWDGKYPAPKNSSQLKRHRDNVIATAYDREKLGTLDAYKSNDVLDFDKLHKIWRKLSDEYMERHN